MLLNDQRSQMLYLHFRLTEAAGVILLCGMFTSGEARKRFDPRPEIVLSLCFLSLSLSLALFFFSFTSKKWGLFLSIYFLLVGN